MAHAGLQNFVEVFGIIALVNAPVKGELLRTVDMNCMRAIKSSDPSKGYFVFRLLCGIALCSLTTASWGQGGPTPAEARVVTSDSLATDYSEQLSVADRLAGL